MANRASLRKNTTKNWPDWCNKSVDSLRKWNTHFLNLIWNWSYLNWFQVMTCQTIHIWTFALPLLHPGNCLLQTLPLVQMALGCGPTLKYPVSHLKRANVPTSYSLLYAGQCLHVNGPLLYSTWPCAVGRSAVQVTTIIVFVIDKAKYKDITLYLNYCYKASYNNNNNNNIYFL